MKFQLKDIAAVRNQIGAFAKLQGKDYPKDIKQKADSINPKFFEDLGARLNAIIAASPAADIEKNARALLASGFAKLDLVSREEFDIQSQVLQRTREKLKALEARLDRLENPPTQPD